jgi:DNA-binding transcriptional MerR regulator
MRTVKQVSDLTGISVRTLHYYDEIGLLKPSKVTEAGYRLYDEGALEMLQQILFFKELDLPLKEVKQIITSPDFDRMQALKNHKRLLILKRNRLDNLIGLVDKILEGGNDMSFKEFDMSEYINALEEFKKEHTDEVTRYWGSMDKFNEFIERIKSRESEVGAMAVKQYGSIEKYTEAMKKNLSNFSALMEQANSVRDNIDAYKAKSTDIFTRLTSDLSRDPSSGEIQQIITELVTSVNESTNNMDMGENYWGIMAEAYSSNQKVIEVTDKLYGSGASVFVGQALDFYSKSNRKDETPLA